MTIMVILRVGVCPACQPPTTTTSMKSTQRPATIHDILSEDRNETICHKLFINEILMIVGHRGAGW